MKTFLLSIFLLLAPLAATSNKQVFVNADSCYIYSQPSYSAEQLSKLKYNDALTLLDDEIVDGFYYIEFGAAEDLIQGYVPADIVGEKIEEQQVITSFNATLLDNAEVRSLTDKSKVCDLKKNTRVFLYEGYDKSKDYLPIKFYYEGKVMFGEVKTEYINPDGINPALIVSIMAIVAVVTIIIILLGITGKKRHKKLKKQK